MKLSHSRSALSCETTISVPNLNTMRVEPDSQLNDSKGLLGPITYGIWHMAYLYSIM
jgi:hypothetical protein